MTVEGVDYAWARPDPVELHRIGKRFASRYLSYSITGKNLEAAERDQLHAAGLSIVLNWETRANAALDGFAAGRTHATSAANMARALGAPAQLPIYFSIDFEPVGPQWTAVAEYFRGIATVLPLTRVGVYGGYETIDRARMGRWATWLWQTYAWSGGRWHPAAHVQQYRNGVNLAGGEVDLNRAMTVYFGQWNPPGGAMNTLQEDWLKDIHFTLTTSEAGGPEHVRWILLNRRMDALEASLKALLSTGPETPAGRLSKVEELVTAMITDVREVRDRPPTVVDPDMLHEILKTGLREVVEDAVAGVLATAHNPRQDDPVDDESSTE
jgi:Domain of unknown function (DUF1906)